jgi:cytochrome c oxidase cbb3-type subunit III
VRAVPFRSPRRMSRVRSGAGAALLVGFCVGAAACERPGGDRRIPDVPATVADARQPALQAGPLRREVSVRNPYDGDRAAVDEGEQLYGWFNCGGCHGPYGGGGIGPPLAGEERNPAHDFDFVYAGRAGGMPAYGGRIADAQIWMILAYVQALGRGEVEVPDAPRGPAPDGIHIGRGAP